MAKSAPYFAAIAAESAFVPPAPADSASPATLAAFYRRVRLQPYPEAELRAQYEWTPEGRLLRERLPDSSGAQLMANMPSPDYRQVRVPALAVFAGKDSIGCLWPAPSMRRTPTVVRYFSEVVQPQSNRDRAQFAREAPDGRVVTIPCEQHELPLTNPAELEKVMRDFFATIQAP